MPPANFAGQHTLSVAGRPGCGDMLDMAGQAGDGRCTKELVSSSVGLAACLRTSHIHKQPA